MTDYSMQVIEDKPQRESSPPIKAWVVGVMLALILILGAVYRLTGVDWDQGQHLHPDERFLTMVETALSLPGSPDTVGSPPQGCAAWGGYFDTACSPLNPYNHDFGLFVYGTFPVFLTRVIGGAIGQFGYEQIYLVGRVLSALFDLLTVLLIFFIGRRLYGTRVGLLSALFLTASVLDIQQSHFFTVDTFTNVPVLIAFWYALDVEEGKKWPAFVFAGLAFGLALAGRINIAPFAAVLIIAAAIRAYRAAIASQRSFDQGPEALPQAELQPTLADGPAVVHRSLGPVSVSVAWGERAAGQAASSLQDSLRRAGTRAFAGLVAAAVATILIFRIAQPYAANGPGFISPALPKLELSRGPINVMFDVVLSWAGGVNPKFADNMSYVSDLVNGKIDYPPGDQWTDRTPYVFPFENMVLWGLGPGLGLAAWAGFLVGLYQLIKDRRWLLDSNAPSAKHLLIVAWVGITFGYSGQQFVKTMRYFLQIYPFLAVLGAYFVIAAWDWARGWAGRWQKSLALAGAGVLSVGVIGYTLFYATAFTTIYTRPVTRVTASRWIFENVPLGSVIANEHWDDPLPLRIDNKDPFGGMYKSLSSSPDGEMDWYNEDTPEKRDQAIRWLDEADYIVLSSNRLYASIPRLPMRYPLTTKYYQWLFDGKLGFDCVATFTSRPELFGIQIDDDNAEEAFTVYDHPKVIIFKKSSRYSDANTVALFDSVDLSEVYRFTPLVATQAKTALLLTPSDSAAQLQGGTWSQLFDPADWINQIPVIGWLGMIEILGWLAFPIAFFVFRGLADRGYIFSKAFGILFPAWGAWILGSFHAVPFSRWSVFLAILVVVVLSAAGLWSRRRDFLSFIREHSKILLVEEALFLVFFGIDLAIRYGNPDLWHPWFGGEKPMDFAFLNAVVKSTWFPPYDPWFAGGYINYYYFGQLITASLIKLSGIVPEVAYNLALPMFFALTAMGAFAVVFNLVSGIQGNGTSVRRSGIAWNAVLAGLAGAVFVAVIGNLGEVALIGGTFAKIGGAQGQDPLGLLASTSSGIIQVLTGRATFSVPIGDWYWNASRVIPDTINEFPFFTFLYADLHAHLMALPFTLVVLGFAVNYVLRPADGNGRLPFLPNVPISPVDIVEVVAASLVVGGLRAINFADYPTYLLVILSAVVVGEIARRRRVDVAGIGAIAWRAAAILVLTSLLYQPFVSHFASAYLGIQLWQGQRTRLVEYLTVHGIFLFVIATWLVWQTFDSRSARGPLRMIRLVVRHFDRLGHLMSLHRAVAAPSTWYEELTIVVAAGAVLFEGLFLLLQMGVFAVAFPLLVLAGLLVLRPNLDVARRFIALLVAAALALTLAVELVTYRDDIGRMNTVFKFYLQVWVFFGLAAAAGLAFMFQPAPSDMQDHPVEKSTLHIPQWWWAPLGLLLFCGMLYPILATRAKVNDRFVAGSAPGLNGMDYMNKAVYVDQNRDMPLIYDREAINWMRENVQGSPIVLEGNAPLYHWGSRFSIYTGLPTVIGWDWHEKQQRSIIDGAIIDHRVADVRTIYDALDPAEALGLLNRYHVSYIVVGDLEKAFYSADGLAKFPAMVKAGELDVVYQNSHVTIYRLVS